MAIRGYIVVGQEEVRLEMTELNRRVVLTFLAHPDDAEFLCAGAFQLPCAAESIDTVCLWDVIEHVPRRSETTQPVSVSTLR